MRPAGDVLDDPALTRLNVGDTVPPFRLEPEMTACKLETLPVALLLAKAIRRLNAAGPAIP